MRFAKKILCIVFIILVLGLSSSGFLATLISRRGDLSLLALRYQLEPLPTLIFILPVIGRTPTRT